MWRIHNGRPGWEGGARRRCDPGRRGAASPQSSAQPERTCTSPVERPGSSGRSTTGPETIEGTAELIEAEGGTATAIGADHVDIEQVRAVVDRIDRDHGRPDVLVNDIWGGEGRFEWDAPLWEADLERGLHLLHLAVDTHLITSHAALPLLIRRPGGLVVEVTDGTLEYNAVNYRLSAFYDLAKWSVLRLGWSQGHELAPHGCTALTITPGWLRSESMLEIYEVTDETWRQVPGHFGISETPRFVGRAVVALATEPHVARWNKASVSSGQLAREYGFTDLDGSAPDAWRYMVEVQDAGKHPEPENYR